ncbi:hypothetical protein PENNAL_c0604G06343, partial [Penicillium nalgiovense]
NPRQQLRFILRAHLPYSNHYYTQIADHRFLGVAPESIRSSILCCPENMVAAGSGSSKRYLDQIW